MDFVWRRTAGPGPRKRARVFEGTRRHPRENRKPVAKENEYSHTRRGQWQWGASPGGAGRETRRKARDSGGGRCCLRRRRKAAPGGKVAVSAAEILVSTHRGLAIYRAAMRVIASPDVPFEPLLEPIVPSGY